jgi:hypothetical protein
MNNISAIFEFGPDRIRRISVKCDKFVNPAHRWGKVGYCPTLIFKLSYTYIKIYIIK